ncbi:purine-nucleoside phosphorylase [Rhodohalobacter halophilus]|uniref:purine-nucleoside phosphorylase n=1 Tax=Rhodohalobacter halophilus TaxID=1812810 RepID=UPI00083FB58D|nr:purine-nucleoside phosphorylase [Rhodohalobacter halophilus]
MTKLPNYIDGIKNFLTDNEFPDKIEAVVILGSGLGDFSTTIDEPFSVPYNQIPNFPHSSVAGHAGELFTGLVNGKKVIAFSGRFHHYEGYPLSKTVLPVHLAKAFNAKKLIVSNAAGAINTNFKVGDLMVIDDVFRVFHKVAPAPSERFQYNLQQTADRVREIAASIGLEVQRGTYLFAKGPSYETKAEIRAFRVMGADVVGMSTAPELIEASRLNLPAAAISLVTNMAAGVLKQKLDHSEVKVAAESRKEDFARLVNELIDRL